MEEKCGEGGRGGGHVKGWCGAPSDEAASRLPAWPATRPAPSRPPARLPPWARLSESFSSGAAPGPGGSHG